MVPALQIIQLRSGQDEGEVGINFE